MSISVTTARNHTQRAIEKLGAHSKLEAVIIAMREGLQLDTPRDRSVAVSAAKAR